MRIKPLFRRLAPETVGHETYKLMTLGVRKYAHYAQLRAAQHIRPSPRAYGDYHVGGSVPVVLHPTTVPAVYSHWVSDGLSIREFRAFRRFAPGHSSLLDVGAAEGIFSAAFCALTSGTSWAFEPSPEMFERLRALAAVNKGLDIRPTQLAMGMTSETVPVAQYPDGQYARVAPGAAAATMASSTLDDFCEQHGVTPDIAKVDVEGMEVQVLSGGSGTFRRYVRTLFLEIHPMLVRKIDGGPSDGVQELETLLRDLGFRLQTLEAAEIRDLNAYLKRERELMAGTGNIVCLR